MKIPVNVDKGYTSMWKGGKPVGRRRIKNIHNRMRRRADSKLVVEGLKEMADSREEDGHIISLYLLDLREEEARWGNNGVEIRPLW